MYVRIYGNDQNSRLFALLLRYLAVSTAIGSLFVLSSAYAASVTLAWDPSPGPGVVGYLVYYGNASGSYSQTFDAGNSTTATLSNLTDGTTYYVVVIAYAAGAQSPPSNQVSFQASAGDAIENLNPYPPVPPRQPGDYNGDGHDDIILQDADGRVWAWLMNGSSRLSTSFLVNSPLNGWKVVAGGDFNGDGYNDIVWQDNDGRIFVWFLQNLTYDGYGAYILDQPISGWRVVGAADFNGDGKDDLLWQDSEGRLYVWFMNGINQTGGAFILSTPISGWRVVGIGDFNGDGKPDLVWQSPGGQIYVWFMNGLSQIGGGYILSSDIADWKVVGTGDYNNDGKPDIVWQNSSGQIYVWYMDGLSQTSGGYLSAGSIGTYRVVISH